MPKDFMGGPFDGITLSKDECELRYTLMRLDSFAAKAEQDKVVYRGQSLYFHTMGKFSRSEIARMRNKARAMLHARKPDAQHVH